MSGQQVALSRLDAQQRQRVWAGIQRDEPALAALLQSEFVQYARKHWGGEVLMDREKVRRWCAPES